jgi:GT2 family glycosyltransferase
MMPTPLLGQVSFRRGSPSYAASVSAPLFTVICPAYNATRTIGATVRSVQSQTFEDFEMVVVDDGSSDGTPELVETFIADDPRIRLVRQANAGTAGARNRALAEARGTFVSNIDNDDLWLPGYIQSMVSAFEMTPEVGLCFCRIWAFNDRSRRVHRQTFDLAETDSQAHARPIPARELEIALLADNFIPASGTALTRAALEAAGGYDSSPELGGSDDWDLWLRVAHAGFGAVGIPEPLAVWRDRHDSESKDLLMMAQGGNVAARRALERNPGDAEIEAAARSMIQLTGRQIAERSGASLAWRAKARARARLSAAKRRAMRRQEWREPPAELRRFLDLVDPPSQPQRA